MKSAPRLGVVTLSVGILLGLGSGAAQGATSTSFAPTTVTIAPGGSATITISTVGLAVALPPAAPAVFAVYADFLLNLPAGYSVSGVACTGIFSGATPTADPIAGSLVSCYFPFSGPGASGPDGDVLTFSLTRGAAAGPGTVTMDEPGSRYTLSNESGETVGTTNSVTIADPLPDLTIGKSHTGNFTLGQTGATYSIVVTNAGAGPTSGLVSMVDALPVGLTATAIAGTGWDCTLATLTCTRSDALAAAASYPAITLTVNVAANAPAAVTNTATVSGGGEVDTTNDAATDPATVAASAPLNVPGLDLVGLAILAGLLMAAGALLLRRTAPLG